MSYANETMRLLYERGSCRAYEDKPIDDQILTDILGAGLHSATGGNLQPYSIIKIHKKDQKNDLVEKCGMQPLVKHAPMNLLFCLDWRRSKLWAEAENAPFVAYDSAKHFWIGFQDVIIAAQSVSIAAESYGIGSVYIGTVESCFSQLRELFKLPEGVLPIVLVSMGYPKVDVTIAPKLMHQAMVHDGVYKDLDIETLKALQNEKYGNKIFPASEDSLDTIHEVISDVYGKNRADEMVEAIKDNNHINMAQRYFGLHYRANWSCTENSNMIGALKEAGYTWTDGIDFPKK